MTQAHICHHNGGGRQRDDGEIADSGCREGEEEEKMLSKKFLKKQKTVLLPVSSNLSRHSQITLII